MLMAGYSFRGRALKWNPVAQQVEQARQRWVTRETENTNALITELSVDPDKAYEQHREAFVETGDWTQFMLMLEYVTDRTR